MEEVMKILESIKSGVDFNKEDNLIEDEILDSFDIVNLVARLDQEFDIEISPADLIPEKFKSVETIYQLVEKLQED